MVPKSPYGVSKLYSFWITKVYRQAYGFHASNEFYLIMKVLGEEKHLLLEKLRGFCQKKFWDQKTYFISGI